MTDIKWSRAADAVRRHKAYENSLGIGEGEVGRILQGRVECDRLAAEALMESLESFVEEHPDTVIGTLTGILIKVKNDDAVGLDNLKHLLERFTEFDPAFLEWWLADDDAETRRRLGLD